MPPVVKRDQARTRLARRAVVEAARTLFLDRGYAATTVDAISEHADVPIATVYRLFASKLGILKALLDTSIAGDDRPVTVSEREGVASLFREPNPYKLIAGFAGVTTAINERTNDLYVVLESAAGSDSAAGELLREIQQQRDRGQGRIARTLARSGALKPELRERDASDIIHAVMSPEVYRLLVRDRRWKPERYEKWLASTLTEQLVER